ncbi:hypothetical protein [Pseudofrankia asymbiotica]|nr:hypothetical protein [Pseudofrankia asymbiotica]
MIQPDLEDQPGKPGRACTPEAEHRRSSSITSTHDRAHPNPTARSTSPYCNRVDT